MEGNKGPQEEQLRYSHQLPVDQFPSLSKQECARGMDELAQLRKEYEKELADLEKQQLELQKSIAEELERSKKE